MIEKTLGERIRELRDSADMSLRELAKKIGVSAPFLSDVELGRRFPSDDKLKLIGEILGEPFEDLQKYDLRDTVTDIKKMMGNDPKVGFAFRTVAEKIKTGDLSAEEILKRMEQKIGKKK